MSRGRRRGEREDELRTSAGATSPDNRSQVSRTLLEMQQLAGNRAVVRELYQGSVVSAEQRVDVLPRSFRRSDPPRATSAASLQRFVELDLTGAEPVAVENKRPPVEHVPLSSGWTPFDEQRWVTDAVYRNNVLTTYQPTNLPYHKSYEQSAAQFVASTGVGTVYRAIRIRGTRKKLGGDFGAEVITVPPDGEPTRFGEGSGAESDVLRRMAVYQQLKAWPREDAIIPANWFADFLPVRHVSGDDYATQYISTALNFDRARICSLTSYSAGNGTLRRNYEWAPVVAIDLTRLGDDCRIVDLRSARGRQEAGFPSDAQAIASLADADGEILITGVIPGSAVVDIFDSVTLLTWVQDDLYRQVAKDRERYLAYRGQGDPGKAASYFGHWKQLFDQLGERKK